MGLLLDQMSKPAHLLAQAAVRSDLHLVHLHLVI